MKTNRFVSQGAEKWLGKEIKCLDYGFVRLVDYLGGDDSVVQSARVSYGRGTKKKEQDRGLIRYLMRHNHTTPFEMVEFKFHAKMPIFVARQWVRHRTANINEYSSRYSQMINEFYCPDKNQLRSQSNTNMQGRGKILDKSKQQIIYQIIRIVPEKTYSAYEELLENGLSRELSRTVLPVSNYTQWYWKIDLHNLFHFLKLRMDSHAQYEIQVFAKAMAEIIKDAVPICWEAFKDYQLDSEKFSRYEKMILRAISQPIREKEFLKIISTIKLDNQREIWEAREKLKNLKLYAE